MSAPVGLPFCYGSVKVLKALANDDPVLSHDSEVSSTSYDMAKGNRMILCCHRYDPVPASLPVLRY